jgi:hypothetical protein
MGRIKPILAMALVGTAGAAAAESVRMTGLFPAEERDVAMLRSIAVERFAGRDGAALAIALERALLIRGPDGRPHFDVVPIGRRGDPGSAEGVISGAVSTDVSQNEFDKTERRCVEKDGPMCKKYEDARVICQRRVIDFRVDVRVADLASQRILYSADRQKRDEISWCEGQQPSRGVEEAVRGMIGATASELARAFAPRFESYSIRFREGTKGMPKEVEKRFKAVVKQTQRDLPGACREWEAIDGEAPNHPSVLFDLGLCAEAAGDYPKAAELYARAAPLMGRGNEGEVGAQRVAGLIAAKADAAERAERR